MILPNERPSNEEIYTTIITDEQNPIRLRFRHRIEAEYHQREFYTGLEQHNEYINSEIRFDDKPSEKYDYELIYWR